MKLKGKIALISGASNGIGKSCAEVFAEDGAKIILLARRKQVLDEVAKEISETYKTETYTLQCDVTKKDEVARAISSLPKEWQDIDILFNNAGLARGLDKIQDGEIEDWDIMIDTNVKGLLYVTHAVLPFMIKRQKGMIINMSSIAGREVYAGGNVYCATKHATKALADSWQIDLNGTGIRVCNIDPGAVETDFSLIRFKGNAERAKLVYTGYETLKARDVAETVLFCATRPEHVSIHDISIYSTAQANCSITNRKI